MDLIERLSIGEVLIILLKLVILKLKYFIKKEKRIGIAVV
jgi:hypothetical protein